MILKLKYSNVLLDCFSKYFNNYDSTDKIIIKNILIYKSDKSLDIKEISNYYKKYLNYNDEDDDNENIEIFIKEILNKNNINTIFLIGCSLDYKIKLVLESYDIYYFEWLNWKNYQVILL